MGTSMELRIIKDRSAMIIPKYLYLKSFTIS